MSDLDRMIAEQNKRPRPDELSDEEIDAMEEEIEAIEESNITFECKHCFDGFVVDGFCHNCGN